MTWFVRLMRSAGVLAVTAGLVVSNVPLSRSALVEASVPVTDSTAIGLDSRGIDVSLGGVPASALRAPSARTAPVALSGVPAGPVNTVTLSPNGSWRLARVGDAVYRSQDGYSWEEILLPADVVTQWPLWSQASTGGVILDNGVVLVGGASGSYRYVSGSWLGPDFGGSFIGMVAGVNWVMGVLDMWPFGWGGTVEALLGAVN